MRAGSIRGLTSSRHPTAISQVASDMLVKRYQRGIAELHERRVASEQQAAGSNHPPSIAIDKGQGGIRVHHEWLTPYSNSLLQAARRAQARQMRSASGKRRMQSERRGGCRPAPRWVQSLLCAACHAQAPRGAQAARALQASLQRSTEIVSETERVGQQAATVVRAQTEQMKSVYADLADMESELRAANRVLVKARPRRPRSALCAPRPRRAPALKQASSCAPGAVWAPHFDGPNHRVPPHPHPAWCRPSRAPPRLPAAGLPTDAFRAGACDGRARVRPCPEAANRLILTPPSRRNHWRDRRPLSRTAARAPPAAKP